ncbi:MAG: helix-turn-helix domain-containing protein [Paracoccaceae bacterium]
MIGRGQTSAQDTDDAGDFGGFQMRMGDMMRGERATLGKSLLDVQRELKIKASYISAIEDADPSAFDTPGFIAGYVRSYARYLGLDPEWTFETFCRESGFSTTHGMAEGASTLRAKPAARSYESDDFLGGAPVPFLPQQDAWTSRIEAGAIGSIAILATLIAGLGWGGYTVLQEIQKVAIAPVDETPVVVSRVDPLAGGRQPGVAAAEAPSVEAFGRLYRPAELEMPVMVSRDAPIATLDPRGGGVLADAAGAAPRIDLASVRPTAQTAPAPGAPIVDASGVGQMLAGLSLDGIDREVESAGVQVTATMPDAVTLVAVRPAWVRVRAADGSVIYETVMDEGDTFAVPPSDDPATLRIGESGAVYFAVAGRHYGPVGPNGAVSSNVALSADAVLGEYEVADLAADQALERVVAELAQPAAGPAPLPVE